MLLCDKKKKKKNVSVLSAAVHLLLSVLVLVGVSLQLVCVRGDNDSVVDFDDADPRQLSFGVMSEVEEGPATVNGAAIPVDSTPADTSTDPVSTMPPPIRCNRATFPASLMASPSSATPLINAAFLLYTTRDNAVQKAIIREHYDPARIEFVDPLMRVEGGERFAVQFHSLIKFFKTVNIVWGADMPSGDTPSTDTPSGDTPSTDTPSTDTPSTDTPSVGPFTTRSPGALGADSLDLIVPNKQTYAFARESWLAKKVLPEVVELDVVTILTVVCGNGAGDDNAADTTSGDTADNHQLRIVRHEDTWTNKTTGTSAFYGRHVKPVVGAVTSKWMLWLGW